MTMSPMGHIALSSALIVLVPLIIWALLAGFLLAIALAANEETK
ncbi:MAG: hypothetical protein ACFB4J_10250 [Elainellaceae cyanobacterium]